MNQTAPETAAPALQDVAIFDGNGENEKSLRNLEKLRNSGFFQRIYPENRIKIPQGLSRDFDFYLKNLKAVLSEYGTGKRM